MSVTEAVRFFQHQPADPDAVLLLGKMLRVRDQKNLRLGEAGWHLFVF